MAKSLLRIVHSIIEKYHEYKPTDDMELPEEFVIDKINDIRSTLIRDEYNNGKIDEKYYQRMCCLDITCEDQGCIIGGTFIPAGTKIYKIELPSLITDIDWNDILFLGSSDFRKFHRKTLDAWISNDGHPATAGMPIYTIIGNEAILKNIDAIDPGMKKACGNFLLSNPIDSCDYNKDTDNYPVPSEYKLELLVMKDITSTGYRGDVVNDAQEKNVDPRTVQQTQQNLSKEQ